MAMMYHNTSQVPQKENTMKRPRIDALLEEGIKGPAMVVAASAGFGKTQAVASFLLNAPYRAVWQQLTPLDNLVARFWESFIYTVSLHRPKMSEKLTELGFPDTLYAFQKFLQLFTEELYVDDRLVVFVFDDFQVIQDPSVKQFFRYFVSANLENICLVFLTRDLLSFSFDPDVYVVTTDDLRFTLEETTLFLKQIDKNDAYNPQQLYAYTNGWPLALGLIRLYLSKEPQLESEQTPDLQQLIFGLIRQELFLPYTKQEQVFFVLISILNAFPKGLIDSLAAFLGVEASQLMNNNPFVLYDSVAHNYYLHQVFLDFLEEKRGIVAAEKREAFLRHAALWCKGNGFLYDAITYYKKLAMHEEVWGIIDGFAGIRHAKHEAEQLIEYIKDFPEDFLREHPMCRMLYAMLQLNNLHLQEALAQMDIVHTQLGEHPRSALKRKLKGEAHVASGLISLGMETFDYADDFKKATTFLPEGSGRYGRNLRLVEFSHALNLPNTQKGVLDEAVTIDFEAMPYVVQMLHGAGYGREYLSAAEAKFLVGDYKQAEQHAYTALYHGEEKEQYDVMYNALFLLLRIYVLLGEDAKLKDVLQRLLQSATQAQDVQADKIIDIALGWYYAEYEKLAEVAPWLMQDTLGNRPPISVDRDALVRIRVLLEEKYFSEALAVLEQLEEICKKRNSLLTLIYVYVYRAIALYQLADVASAESAIANAYALAYENEMYAPFYEYGHKLRSLYDNLLKNVSGKLPQDWLVQMRSRANTYSKRHNYLRAKLDEQDVRPDFGLSDREVELLWNLSQGLVRDEIAHSMYISPHTVKSMLKTVYNKIGAINSADAVRIAITAGII